MSSDVSIFANLIAEGCDKYGDKTILTFVDEYSDVNQGAGTVETRSYKELYRNGNALAAFLLEQGMKKGDRFAVLLRNHPEIVEALVAASITGCVMVPIDPRTKGDKLAFMLGNSDCRGVICADYNAPEVAAVAPESPLQWSLLLNSENSGIIGDGLPGLDTYFAVASQEREPVEIRSESGLDTLQVLYTSGTTGDPKGIVKPNAAFAVGGKLLPVLLGFTEDDVLYTGLSLTHGNAQFFTLAVSLAAGIPSVYSRKFSKSKLWDTVRRHGCTVFNLLGGMTAAVYSEAPKANDADNPVRMVVSAGMPAAIWEDFSKRFDLNLFEVYGAAEGGLFWNNGSGPAGSFGHLNENPIHEARIVDADGNDCAAGVSGELIWRNRDDSAVVVEYLNNPQASAKKTADGWFRTGDIVHTDSDGWLYFDYRDGGGIRRNGDFINPGFVEKAIAELDAVDDVFVYGVPAASGAPGEKDVVAAIVARNANNFDSKALFRACRTSLESNFVPSYLQLVDEIPKTASEKPQERFLLERFAVDAEGVFTE